MATRAETVVPRCPRSRESRTIVAKAKWTRPVIVVSAAAGAELTPNSGANLTKTYLCAPIYGCDQFPKDLVERVRAYEFPNLFYLPECKKPRIDEGFIRLDHLQAIDKTKLQNRRSCLTEEAMTFFDEWLGHYTTGVLPDGSLVDLYRSEYPAEP